jgi:hypothetical protein|tara:strand:+ start:572 stop:1162 length:591 start_codon:yes stop_codon:yes gene_type:complete
MEINQFYIKLPKDTVSENIKKHFLQKASSHTPVLKGFELGDDTFQNVVTTDSDIKKVDQSQLSLVWGRVDCYDDDDKKLLKNIYPYLNLPFSNDYFVRLQIQYGDNKNGSGDLKPHIDGNINATEINIPLLGDFSKPVCWFNEKGEIVKQCYYDNHPVLINTEIKHAVFGVKKPRVFIRIKIPYTYESMYEKLKSL